MGEHVSAAVPLWLIQHWADQGPMADQDAWHYTCECGLEERDVSDRGWRDPKMHGELCTWAVAQRILNEIGVEP
jgi:hypothetical protein